MHGTNVSIVFYKDGRIAVRGRNRVVGFMYPDRPYSLEEDDFCKVVATLDPAQEELRDVVSMIRKDTGHTGDITLYGEWVGPEIMAVALSMIPQKSLVLFGYCLGSGGEDQFGRRVGPRFHVSTLPTWGLEGPHVYRIDEITKMVELTIDLSNEEPPEDLIVQLKSLVEDVETECPAARYFGVEGGVGEGWVFSIKGEDYKPFKFKGKRHEGNNIPAHLRTKKDKKAETYDDETLFVQEHFSLTSLEGWMLEMGLEKSPKSIPKIMTYALDDFMEEVEHPLRATSLSPKRVRKAAGRYVVSWINS